MKTGLILYVTGTENRSVSSDRISKILAGKADLTEVITSTEGHADIHDAWWHLVARGMHRVVCRIAETDAEGDIRLTDRQIRLCG